MWWIEILLIPAEPRNHRKFNWDRISRDSFHQRRNELKSLKMTYPVQNRSIYKPFVDLTFLKHFFYSNSYFISSGHALGDAPLICKNIWSELPCNFLRNKQDRLHFNMFVVGTVVNTTDGRLALIGRNIVAREWVIWNHDENRFGLVLSKHKNCH